MAGRNCSASGILWCVFRSRLLGVRGRNSDNRLIREKLGWKPTQTLREGLEKTYPWIKEQVGRAKNEEPCGVKATRGLKMPSRVLNLASGGGTNTTLPIPPPRGGSP